MIRSNLMTLEKIKPHHLQKTGFVYLRQSSPGQVKKNVEGARRQRRMEDRMKELGWPAGRIQASLVGRAGK